MPFLEFLGLLIAIAIFAVVFCIVMYAGGVLLLVLISITAILGWIPILSVYSDPDWTMSFSGNFIEAWAAWAMLEYVVLIIGWVTISSYIAFADGELPLFLKAIAWLFPHPAANAVRKGTQRSLNHPVPTNELTNALRQKPVTRTGMRIQEYQSKKLKGDLEAETRWLRGQTEIAQKSVESNRERVRAVEYRNEERRLRNLKSRSQGAYWALSQLPSDGEPTDE